MAKPHVAIIDYQMSNLFSVQNACETLGIDAQITTDPNIVRKSDGAILPGMGAFGEAMRYLDSQGLSNAIKTFIQEGKPFIGVCLGLQLLFDESEEFGMHKGLGVMKGAVKKFPAQNSQKEQIKIPQIGWNQISTPLTRSTKWKQSPLEQLKDGSFMYFVHSFYVDPADTNDIIAETTYEGFTYCSAVQKDNVFATQFHPEKSGKDGVGIYESWAKQSGLL